MAKNRSVPLMTMMTNAAMVNGSRRSTTSDTGTFRIVQPSRRRSNITTEPKNTAIVHTWIDSMME